MSNSEPSTPNILIQTKLTRPRLSRNFLPRPHLLQRLEQGRHHKLTLISAPAGYGKSTLTSAWLDVCDCRSAWLSLDKNDNDLRTFLSYFITAVQTVFPDCCLETQALLEGMQLPPQEYLTTTLINESVALPEPFVIALDDYQLIQNKNVHRLLDTLIRYQSEKLHLVIITRQDPLLSVATLRARGLLTEIRINDLRFNSEEVQRYWQVAGNEKLSPELVDSLATRTEGWVAGLHLASLAFQGRGDDIGFLKTFDGTHQYVMGYLTDEVLTRQSETVQAFLLRTSILDRFCAPLTDALMTTADGENTMMVTSSSQDILEQLTTANLFLIPLDHEGRWFRYHHLFQDLLFHKLRTEKTSEHLASLHVAAGVWLEQNGFVDDALEHYFSANDIAAAVALVQEQRYALMNQTQWQRLEQQLHQFSPDIQDQYPYLLMLKTWLIYHHGHWIELPAALQQVEAILVQASLTPEEVNYLQGEISALRSLLSYHAVDPKNTLFHAQQALEKTAPELWIVRILARLHLAGALLMTGDLNRAYAAIYRGFEDEQTQSDLFKATLVMTVCHVHWIAADLQGMTQAAIECIRLCQNTDASQILNYGHYHLGSVCYQQNDLDAAERHLSVIVRQPFLNYGDTYAYSACGLALTYQAQDRPNEAREVAESAIAFMLQTGNTSLLPVVQAFQAELALRQGQMPMARQWASHLSAPPPITPLFRPYEPHFTLLKVWLAQKTSTSSRLATDFLNQLKAFFKRTHNTRFLMETLAYQALLDDTEGRREDAVAALEKAVKLAEPGGFIRVFVDLGPQIARLLATLRFEDAETRRYVAQILVAFAPAEPKGVREQGLLVSAHPLLEPLTDREMDVLNLLAQRQTDREIAARLMISVSTVRTHTTNIRSKLDVHNRRQAVQRAKELGILSTI